MVCRLNGGNLRDTGHSFEAGPMAALAELCELPLWQVSECNGHFTDCYRADVSFRSWPEAAVCTAEWVSLKLMTRVIITVLLTPPFLRT